MDSIMNKNAQSDQMNLDMYNVSKHLLAAGELLVKYHGDAGKKYLEDASDIINAIKIPIDKMGKDEMDEYIDSILSDDIEKK